MNPCPHDNRTEDGICLRLTHGLPQAEFDEGWQVMCEKEKCPIYGEVAIKSVPRYEVDLDENCRQMIFKNESFGIRVPVGEFFPFHDLDAIECGEILKRGQK